MRAIVAKVAALVGLALVFMVSWNCNETLVGPDTAVRMSPREIGVGTLWAGVWSVTAEVEITNIMTTSDDGTGPTLQFRGFTRGPSCPAEFVWEPATATLAAGESELLLFRFSAENAYAASTCELTMDYGITPAAAATRYSDDPPILEVIYAAVEGGCQLSPDAYLDFGEVEVGNSSNQTLTVNNMASDYLGDLVLDFKPSFEVSSGDCSSFSVNSADTTGVLADGESQDINVEFSPAAEGSFQCTLSFSPLRDPEDPSEPEAPNNCPDEVVLSGTGLPAATPEWTDCSLTGFSQDLYGLYGASSSEIYAAGGIGDVLKSGGTCVWEDLNTGISDVTLAGVWANSTASDTAVWAVGNLTSAPTTGAIVRGNASGWSKVDEDFSVAYGDVWGGSLDDIYFVGTGIASDFPNGRYWNGATVDTFTIDFGMSELTGVNGTANDDVWIVLGESSASYSVYRFQGTQWANQTLPFTPNPLNDVWVRQGTGFYAVYAVGDDGGIYHYDGSTWTDESISGEDDDFFGVWVSETGQVWAVGENGKIYHKSGTTWTRQNPPAGIDGDLYDVWGSSDENVFAAGADGLILRYAW